MFLIFIVFTASVWHSYGLEPIKCVSYQKDFLEEIENDTRKELSEEYFQNNLTKFDKTSRVNYKECPDEDYCFSAWTQDAYSNSFIILSQGCWSVGSKSDSDDLNVCESPKCISRKEPSVKHNNTRFCCCSSSLCNNNFTDGYIPPTILKTSYSGNIVEDGINNENPRLSYIMYLYFPLFLILLVIILMVITRIPSINIKKNDKERNFGLVNLVESPISRISVLPTLDFENIEIERLLANGKYGQIWKATFDGQDVAVKIVPSQHKQYFINEVDIYQLPFMEHPSILHFYGNEERRVGPMISEYYLVMSYASNGSLQDYLKSNIIDWPTLCRMISSISSGLAHLHTEIIKDGLCKPCISHRDLSSRNVLVKDDLSCALCDFGISTKISKTKFPSKNFATVPHADEGTLRFMAPEILEGAVNLLDYDSFLRQIDVYSLGLVMWEISSRCKDLYQGFEVPPYKQPYEQETGSHPTYEQMQVLVVHRKARPLFPDVWGNSNPAIRSLKETIEDCWDHDAEARLTALCVEERVNEFPILWARHKSGCRNNASLSNTVSNFKKRNPFNSKNSQVIYDLSNGFSNEKLSDKSNPPEISETTAETYISPSESEKTSFLQNVSHSLCNVSSMTLQPYQGKNTCNERNLMIDSDDNNVNECGYLQKKLKFSNPKNYYICDHNIDSEPLVGLEMPIGRECPARLIRNTLPIPLLHVAVASMPKEYKASNEKITEEKSDRWSWKLLKRWAKKKLNIGNLWESRKKEWNSCDNFKEKDPLSVEKENLDEIITENSLKNEYDNKFSQNGMR